MNRRQLLQTFFLLLCVTCFFNEVADAGIFGRRPTCTHSGVDRGEPTPADSFHLIEGRLKLVVRSGVGKHRTEISNLVLDLVAADLLDDTNSYPAARLINLLRTTPCGFDLALVLEPIHQGVVQNGAILSRLNITPDEAFLLKAAVHIASSPHHVSERHTIIGRAAILAADLSAQPRAWSQSVPVAVRTLPFLHLAAQISSVDPGGGDARRAEINDRITSLAKINATSLTLLYASRANTHVGEAYAALKRTLSTADDPNLSLGVRLVHRHLAAADVASLVLVDAAFVIQFDVDRIVAPIDGKPIDELLGRVQKLERAHLRLDRLLHLNRRVLEAPGPEGNTTLKNLQIDLAAKAEDDLRKAQTALRQLFTPDSVFLLPDKLRNALLDLGI